MIVDDDEGIVDVATIVLSEKGYQVEAVMDPEKMFERINKSKPSVILLDLWMPQMSGEEVLLRLKGDEETRDIPVIIVSASKDTERIARNMDANGVLTKPFDIEDLENLVSEYIS